MKDRIRQIMESQHMTQKVFAQYIDMSEASLSSIFNERTQPTLKIVEAIRKKFPDISIDWLMSGEGSMYRSKEATKAPTPQGEETKAHDQNTATEILLPFDNTPTPVPENTARIQQNTNSVANTLLENSRELLKFLDKPQRRVIEVRLFYDDQTWDTFVLQKGK